LDSGAATKITFANRRLNKADFEKAILIPYREGGLDLYRKEYNKMLMDKATGVNSMVQEKYVTISVCNLTTARKHLCQFAMLKYQQMDGLNTALPIGLRKINALRTLTTGSLAVLIPFRVQEIMEAGACILARTPSPVTSSCATRQSY
jgi:hypothetical protein